MGTFVPVDDCITILKYLLVTEKSCFTQVSSIIRFVLLWEISLCEDLPLWECVNKDKLLVVIVYIESINNFSNRDLLIHTLLAARMDIKSASGALQVLSSHHKLRLLRYISRSMKIYTSTYTPYYVSIQPRNISTEISLPPLTYLLIWACCLVDSSLSILILYQKGKSTCESLEIDTKKLLKWFGVISRMEGIIGNPRLLATTRTHETAV